MRPPTVVHMLLASNKGKVVDLGVIATHCAVEKMYHVRDL